MKKIILKFILMFVMVLGIGFMSSKIWADELVISDKTAEIVSKNDIIQSYSNNAGIDLAQAEKELFSTKSRTRREAVSYIRLSSSAQYSTLNATPPYNAGTVYFYCEVSVSGNFRGIKRIVYAGYNSGKYAFKGNFQYHLEDPNKIHYTLSGSLHSHTTSSGTLGTSIGVGQSASINISLTSSSTFIRSILYHGDRYY